MSTQGLFRYLKEELGLQTQSEIATFLGYTQGHVSGLKNSQTVGSKQWDRILRRVYRAGFAASSSGTLDSWKTLATLRKDGQLAKLLGVTSAAVSQWRSGVSRIPQQRAQLFFEKTKTIRITPLCEMKLVNPTKPGGKWYFYPASEDGSENPKRTQLLAKLASKTGLYIYFDGQGRPTYFGKADRTPLSTEAEARLKAPVERIRYAEDLKKPPKSRKLCQGHIVKYLSAYEIQPRSAIATIEALLIHSAANVVHNERLERVR